MPHRNTHSSITIGDVVHDLTHLNPFTARIPGKGVRSQTDLIIIVSFSNHVFTRRAKHDEPHDALDFRDIRRVFDHERYVVSKSLPHSLNLKIEQNALTFISRSYGDICNLMFADLANGDTWAIIYCLLPHDQDQIHLQVLSAHPKAMRQQKVSRFHLSYFARKCLYEQKRVPEND